VVPVAKVSALGLLLLSAEAAAQESACFMGAAAAQHLAAAVQNFLVGKPAAAAAAAAAQGSSLSAPNDARGAAGAAGGAGGLEARGAGLGADAPPAAAPNGPGTGAGLDAGPASEPDLSQAQARRAPLAAQRTEPVRRLVVCSLGGPEWRLRAPPGDAYRDAAGLGAGGHGAGGGAGGSAGRQQAAARSDGSMPGPDPGMDPDCAGGARARAGTEVLRSAFRIKGALRGARCAGVLSFPGGAPPPGPRRSARRHLYEVMLEAALPCAWVGEPACAARLSGQRRTASRQKPQPSGWRTGACSTDDKLSRRHSRCWAMAETAFVPHSCLCAAQGCSRRMWRCGWRTCATRWWPWRRCAMTPASPASRPTPPGAARTARELTPLAAGQLVRWSWPRRPQRARPSGLVVAAAASASTAQRTPNAAASQMQAGR